jgi:hypothetical protein
MVATDPAAVAAHVARVLDAPQSAVEGGFAVGATDDRVSVLTPAALSARYPELASIDATTPRFVAYRVTVDDPRVARSVLDGEGMPYRATANGVVISPANAFGVALELGAA